ncbi:hypothetical protein BCR34DRAFT_208722 [Clohesyomyces aquaticus]|uniref:MARVEL domain-containing protein n=1 Tax=Clohesyomyces aquaticus TaxID=1231657 RepID=A0A1Y2AAA3_9PLEO|nr:hypothetical protein BCR34DRAFT_208722 [Clohesyomyces aquaticus]
MSAHSLTAISSTLELLLLMTVFILFVCAYPDTYRSNLWAEGGRRGWNSDPQQRVYDFANYRPLRDIPLIWDQQLTDSNLATSIVSLVAWAAKLLWKLRGYRFVGVTLTYDALLCALWGCAIASQSSSDLTDANHLSFRPWYLEKSCGAVHTPVRKYCVCAKFSFGFSVLTSAFFGLRACMVILRQVYLCGQRRALENPMKGPLRSESMI